MAGEDDDEILDLVDANDNVVGTISHAKVYSVESLHGNYIRAASCFLVSSVGKVWVPTRQAHKKIAPNGLDYSAGGHVASGETYDQAIIRELAEELNITALPSELVCIGKETPEITEPSYYFSQLYVYHSDDTPTYNTDDFASAEWLNIDEFQHKLASGIPAKTSLAVGVEILSTYLRQQKAD